MSKLYNKILLTTDGSDYSLNAVEHALSIANGNDAEVIVLNVIEDNFVIDLLNAEIIKDVRGILNEKSQKNLKQVRELKEDLGYDVKLSFRSVEGSPVNVILKTIDEEDIDLVVIGSSGKTGLDKFIMGSVASKVVNSAKCSVLVIR